MAKSLDWASSFLILLAIELWQYLGAEGDVCVDFPCQIFKVLLQSARQESAPSRGLSHLIGRSVEISPA
jgi:hypothetical protein